MVTLSAPYYVPKMPNVVNDQALTVNYDVVSTTGETIENICQIPKTGTITGFGWINMLGTSSNVAASIETVGTTGFASGTLYHANATTASTSVVVGANEVTFTGFTATAGDIVAVIIEDINDAPVYPAFLKNIANQRFPYYINVSKEIDSAPVLYFIYNDGSKVIPRGCFGMNAITSVSLSSTQTHVGNVIIPEVDMKVSGAWIYANVASDCSICLLASNYDGTNNILAQVDVDSDTRDGAEYGVLEIAFPEVSLTAGTKYRIAAIYSAGTTAQFQRINYINQSWQDADWLGSSSTVYATEVGSGDPTGDGDWTDYNTGSNFGIYMMGVVVSEITTTTGGGGSFQISGASGG